MLLKGDNFVCLIKENYPSIINKYREVHDKRLFWELIKMEIRSLTIPYSKNKARQNRLKESNILKRIEELDVLICNSNNLQAIDSELNEYERLKRDLQRHYESKGESAIFRSKVRWTQQGETETGEKPTKYFFNLEKKNFNQRVIAKIKTTPDGSAIVDETEILNEIQRFYADLYKSDSEENSDVADFDAFTHELHLPKLSNAERDALEGMLTIEECKTTLRTFSLGKSPGEDGFTVEFYNTFYEILGQDLVNSLNESYELGELSISQRRGVISLVPKEDSNLLLLSNWRPITLLNVDYKIASKTIAKRIGAEILANKIRQSKNVSGINIYQHEFKISQFADDTSLLCKDITSVENAITIINEFGVISGLRLNPTKTKALWLGPWRNNDATPLSFKWSKVPERASALGIYVSYDHDGNYKKNFTGKIDKLYNKLGFWRSRNLTLLGRSLIFKCLGIPQLVFSASILSNPRAKCSRQITSHLFNFIWNNKPDRIKREVMYSDYAEGGFVYQTSTLNLNL